MFSPFSRNYGAYEDENPYSAYQNNNVKNNMNAAVSSN